MATADRTAQDAGATRRFPLPARSTAATSYRGRFAPTPSGPLHLGSLVMAAASWLDARRHDGVWLVRIDDIDPPREVAGAADVILRQLTLFGLHWDDQVIYQSQRHPGYEAAVQMLLQDKRAFYCRLSRRELEACGQIHPGPAAASLAAAGAAVRLAVPDQPICFDDRALGSQSFRLDQQEGAFVIRRRDDLYAYQLACALDDADLAITDVVRGMDLLDSTPRQIHVLDSLSRPAPRYAHLPVVVDGQGNKLSKSAGSAAVDRLHPGATLSLALSHLGLDIAADEPSRMLDEALQRLRNTIDS
ncbi:MAG: tRNA glutamyl-Q(34) synthetase GluQRS [Alcanivoracaceae bacterium]